MTRGEAGSARVPVGRVVDHGPDREFPPTGRQPGPYGAATLYADHVKAIGRRSHIVLAPGDRLSLRLDLRRNRTPSVWNGRTRATTWYRPR